MVGRSVHDRIFLASNDVAGSKIFNIVDNQAKLVLLKNEIDPPSFFEIRMKGRPRNSAAIGSQLNIDFVDGTQRLYEIRAGGSYLSQSTPTVLLPGKSVNDVKSVRVLWPNGETTTWKPKPGSENRVTIVNKNLN